MFINSLFAYFLFGIPTISTIIGYICCLLKAKKVYSKFKYHKINSSEFKKRWNTIVRFDTKITNIWKKVQIDFTKIEIVLNIGFFQKIKNPNIFMFLRKI
jgi:hypothetical protein